MFPTDHLVAFGLTAFVLIVIPGPSVLYVVMRAVTLGRSAGLAAVAGNTSGLSVQVMAVALGIGAVVERSIAAFTIIKFAGAAYLIYLGVQALRHRRALSQVLLIAPEPKTKRRIFRDGFAVGSSNPKTIILFTAILPQFIDRAAGHIPVQLLFLGMVTVGIALVSDSAWALTAGTARAWFNRAPRRLETLTGTGALVMIGLGVRLAFAGRSN